VEYTEAEKKLFYCYFDVNRCTVPACIYNYKGKYLSGKIKKYYLHSFIDYNVCFLQASRKEITRFIQV